MIEPCEFIVCLKDRKQRRRPKAVMQALCAVCRRNCPYAALPPRGPKRKYTRRSHENGHI